MASARKEKEPNLHCLFFYFGLKSTIQIAGTRPRGKLKRTRCREGDGVVSSEMQGGGERKGEEATAYGGWVWWR